VELNDQILYFAIAKLYTTLQFCTRRNLVHFCHTPLC